MILLTACKNTPDKMEDTTSLASTTSANEKKAAVKKEPVTAIDSDVLYLLLTGETALQRHKYDVALEAYLEAARRVKDPRIAEKAAQISQAMSVLPKNETFADDWKNQEDKQSFGQRQALISAVSKKDQATLIKELNAVLKSNPAAFEETLLDLEKTLKNKQEEQFLGQALEILVKQHPKQAMLFLTQSLLAVRQNNLELARQKIQQTLLLQPEWEKAKNFEAELLLYSGRLAFRNKQFSEAMKWFDKVTSDSYLFEAKAAAISVLIEQQKLPEAATRLEQLLAKTSNPKQKIDVIIMQAELLGLQKNYSQAIESVTRALKDTPDNRELLYTRALTAEKMGDFEAMEVDLQAILKQDANDVTALNALGYSLLEHTTRYDEAEKYLQQALKLKPDESMVIDSYGWLQFKKGNFTEALKYLRLAHDKMPEGEITVHLAETLVALGKKQEAEVLVREALKKTPTDESLLEFQRRVFKSGSFEGQLP